MELGPVPGIRAVRASTVRCDECEVQPPFALDASGRMEDDAYDDSRQEKKRGLEEDSEAGDGVSESVSRSSDAEGRVNFLV